MNKNILYDHRLNSLNLATQSFYFRLVIASDGKSLSADINQIRDLVYPGRNDIRFQSICESIVDCCDAGLITVTEDENPQIVIA